MVTAFLKNYRQSPRKVRLIADLIKSKDAVRALGILRFVDKRAADPVIKLLNSAVANAKHNFNLAPEDLYIKEIRVDEGTKGRGTHRLMPGARGRGFMIKKKMSHIRLTLGSYTDAATKVATNGVKKESLKAKKPKAPSASVKKASGAKKTPAKKTAKAK